MMNLSSWMDEFLCEYVDDTMDYSVRVAFEECVKRDSKLAKHIQHLRGTRTMLCEFQYKSPKGLRSRVKKRLSRCLPMSSSVRPPCKSILIGTAIAIALSAALVAGISRPVQMPLSNSQGSSHLVIPLHRANMWRIKTVNTTEFQTFSQVGALSSEV